MAFGFITRDSKTTNDLRKEVETGLVLYIRALDTIKQFARENAKRPSFIVIRTKAK